MVIEEFGAVIAIKSFQGKGEITFDIFNLFNDTVSAAIPSGSTFRLSGVNIGKRQIPDEVAGQKVTAMGDNIGLKEAGLRDIPVMGADGNPVA